MYAVIIGVPFRRIGDHTCEVASDWRESLFLLRDSLRGRFGPIRVAAPEIPAQRGAIGEQVARAIDEQSDGISFQRLGWTHWRARHFWAHYPRIRAECDHLARRAQVVHAGVGDLWQPYALLGSRAAWRAGRTSVFVLDGDIIRRLQDFRPRQPRAQQFKETLYCRAYWEIVKTAVARADLSLLKGRMLHRRYGVFARNAADFYNTSYRTGDIIPPDRLIAKCRAILNGGPIRCLSLGRLVEFKCVDHSIRAVVAAAAAGCRMTLDIIGQGPDEPRLRRLVEDLGARHVVRFLGARQYGPELLTEVANWDVLLFTSPFEETPRSLFDGLAAGCALIAYDTPYANQVVAQCHHGWTVRRGAISHLAQTLKELDRDRASLAAAMRQAGAVAPDHAAEVWYRRRAEWTFEAYDRHCRRIGQ